jgi:hypothetical protein
VQTVRTSARDPEPDLIETVVDEISPIGDQAAAGGVVAVGVERRVTLTK